jgi:hypothetical protein
MTGLLRSAVSIGLALSAGAAQRPAIQAPRLGEPATLIGTLSASDGQPIAGARVQLATLDLRPLLEVTTDAEGAFRMTPIDPGQYLVRLIGSSYAVELQYVRFLSGRTVNVMLRKGVVIRGRVVDEKQTPVGGVYVCGLRTQSIAAMLMPSVPAQGATTPPSYVPTPQVMTDADGRFLIHDQMARGGDYLVAAFPTGCQVEVPRRPLAARLAKYPTSFAPAVSDHVRATTFEFDPRTEPAPVSITMTPGGVTHLTGRVAGYSNTSVVPGRVILEPPDAPVSIVRVARIAADGRFDFHALPPGEYRLIVPPHADPVAPPSWSIATVVVKGAPTQQVTLQLRPTMAVAGSVSFDGHQQPLYGVRVFSAITASPAGGRPATRRLLDSVFSAVDEEGHFLIKGVMPGEYRLSTGGYVSLGWTTVSATLPAPPGQAPLPDALDVPFSLEPGRSLFGVRILVTGKPGSMAGTVLGRDDRPVAGTTVLAFATDSSYWQTGSRRIIRTVTREDGAFETTFLPDGDYFVVAGSGAEPDGTPPASALTPLMAGATRVTVKTGPPTRVSLRLSTGAGTRVTKPNR